VISFHHRRSLEASRLSGGASSQWNLASSKGTRLWRSFDDRRRNWELGGVVPLSTERNFARLLRFGEWFRPFASRTPSRARSETMCLLTSAISDDRAHNEPFRSYRGIGTLTNRRDRPREKNSQSACVDAHRLPLRSNPLTRPDGRVFQEIPLF